MKLLQEYYEGKIASVNEEERAADNANDGNEMEVTEESIGLLEEQLAPRKKLPPLLMKLSERRAESLNYLGVSFGLTSDLLRFWKKIGYLPVYLRQTANELTGEHSCIMLKELGEMTEPSWLYQYFVDFRRRFLSLLGYQFRVFLPSMCLNVIKQDIYPESNQRNYLLFI